jgi:hypothetical protein
MLRSDLEAAAVEIKDLKHKLDHSSSYTILSPPCEACVSLKGKLFHAIKENTELQQEVAYLTARLKKTVLSEKMIEDDLSQVEESATKSTYRLGVGFERCEKKGENRAPIFVPSSSYHTEEEALKPIKPYYPSNPNPFFNPKREVWKETPKLREEVFICRLCGRAGHLDEFIDFPPRSYSHVLHRFYPCASPCTFSCALPRTSSSALVQLGHRPNHRSYGFGPRENCFEPRRFGYGPRPRCGDHFSRRSGFSAGGSFPHFELRHLDGPRFPYCGSRPTLPSGEMQRTVNDWFTLNDVALVDRLRYNLLSVSQLCDADLSVLFRKSDSHVLDSSGKRVYGISHIGNIFQADFFVQSSLRCLISQSSSELWKWHRRLGHLSFDLLCRLSGLGLL